MKRALALAAAAPLLALFGTAAATAATDEPLPTSVVLKDAHADVTVTTTFGNNTMTMSPVPDDMDIFKVQAWSTAKNVVFVMTIDDLTKKVATGTHDTASQGTLPNGYFSLPLLINGATTPSLLVGRSVDLVPHVFGYDGTKTSDAVDCDPVTVAFDYKADTIRYTVPVGCLGETGTVTQIRAAGMLISNNGTKFTSDTSKATKAFALK